MENQTAPAANETPNGPNLSLQGVSEGLLVRSAAGTARRRQLGAADQPRHLATASNPIGGDLREIVLTVTVSAKQNDKTLFLVEVKQAGAVPDAEPQR